MQLNEHEFERLRVVGSSGPLGSGECEQRALRHGRDESGLAQRQVEAPASSDPPALLSGVFF